MATIHQRTLYFVEVPVWFIPVLEHQQLNAWHGAFLLLGVPHSPQRRYPPADWLTRTELNYLRNS